MLRCLIAVPLLLSLAAETSFAEAKAKQPNIVFIMADDLGYGDLGCFGQKKIGTPHIDRIAAEGMKLTNFYAGSTVCAPSRCVLMTGLHTGHCYIRGNGKLNLRPEDVTVAEVLKEAGYATAMFGKWGLGHENSTGLPTRQGFDEFYGYLDQHHAHNYYPSFLIHNGKRVKLKNVVPGEGMWGQGVAKEKVEYSHDLIMERALKWVDAAAKEDKPFFLYLPLTIPHANNEARNKGMEVPEFGKYANRKWPEAQKGHAAMIDRMDRDIGRLMRLLKTNDVDENTVVFFTSDNGPHREGGNNPDFTNSNGPLRGIKRALYDGGIRVPTIVRWPGKIKAGSESRFVGSFADVLPTLAALSGGKLPKKCDGISFVNTLRGLKQRPHKYLYWEFYEGGSKRAVRFGPNNLQWKAIEKPAFSGKIELYDITVDHGEQKNIADVRAEEVAQAKEYLKAAHVPSPLWKVRKRPRRKPKPAK